MSSQKELLLALAARGIHVYVEEGKLRTRSEPGAITADIAAQIRAHKDGLIALLSAAAPAAAGTLEIAPAPPAQDYVLSFAQQRLWFLDHFQSAAASYNMPMALRLRGRLDAAALQRTLDNIVQRHAILRTTYRKSAAGGVQVIQPAGPVALEDADLSAHADADAEIARRMRAEATQPFDLAADRMLRATLLRLAADHHILLLTLHHIAADGWSLGVLVKEFIALYQAFSAHRDNPLAPLPIQYADFAVWQREHCKGERSARDVEFWRDCLRGLPVLHGLPLDRPRPLALSAEGGVVRQQLDAPLLEALRQLAARRNASLFMLLQSAFALLVARWSGERDIAIGTPVAGRVSAATEDLIGCFINTLVLRTRLDADMSVERLLDQGRTAALRAYEHQQLPFELLVEALNPERSLSHTPLFQLMFALQNYEVGALELPGLSIEELANDAQNTKFDLGVMAAERSDGLHLTWVFASSLFDAASIECLAAGYATLLREIAADPTRAALSLPLLDAAACAQILAHSRASGRIVLDEQGRLQPFAVSGVLYEVAAAADWSALLAGAVAGADLRGHGLRESGLHGRLRRTGAIETFAADAWPRLNGMAVDTARIAAALGEVDGVGDAHVTVRAGVETPQAQALVAYVAATTDDSAALAARCREHLKTRIPDYLLPRALVVLPALPRDADGRIRAGELPAPAVAAAAAKPAYTAPAHALEAQLCEIWCGVLSLPQVGIHDNFFDVGGSSLHSILLQQEIAARLGQEVSVTDIFTYPTIADLARFLRAGDAEPAAPEADADRAAAQNDAIAVIGMAGRFPDAAGVDAFWGNLRDGVESLTVFSDDELRKAGVGEALLQDPAYVKSGVVLPGLTDFDAAYFGFTPREAEVMDPQQRLLFECAVEALEHAGYGDEAERRAVAVYVGVGESRYLFEHLLPQPALIEPRRLAALYGNRPDYAATRLSYRLNLGGPSINVGTACSTSLVAVHQACTSLRNNECELALAGGAAIAQLGPNGYLFQEGSIASPDGHCRTFDAAARGTRAGSGAGLVVLKRLQRALADGDTIHAVIKGSAVNNDGAGKVGYTAPSVPGQAQVIRDAQRNAGVSADSIQYIETHGTATELGDPIEIKALTRAFAGAPRNSIGLGSLKPNIGHLDAAAGVAGLIKAVLALKHAQLPPSINFHTPNPKIDFEQSPFYVNAALRDWPAVDGPRRAGVSSFGIGGTNAHVVLEQAPAAAAADSPRGSQLLLLSAKSEAALEQAAANLRDYLRQPGAAALADVAYTLQRGRSAHPFRRAVVAASAAEALAALEQGAPALQAHCAEGESASVVFLFTGQGAQYLGMGQDLYRSEPGFAAVVDHCAALLQAEFALDLRAVLLPADDEAARAAAQAQLARTDIAQPALFVLEYALATLLLARGVEPAAMIGHSLGEYVAACVAGVFSLDDALRVVARRGRLMQQAPAGRMLAISLGEQEAAPLLAAGGCCLAAVNSARDCVASGPAGAIEALAAQLQQRGIAARAVHTAQAFHSSLMDEVAGAFRGIFDGIVLSAPARPYLSNVSGDYIRAEDAVDPDYWVRHMRGTVRFAAGVDCLAADTVRLRGNRVYLEIGPGPTLAGLLRKHAAIAPRSVVTTLRHAQETQSDTHTLCKALGQLWLAGVGLDWAALHGDGTRRRVPLPTYPFQRQRFWIERASDVLAAPLQSGRVAAPRDWFHAPVWQPLPPLPAPPAHSADDRRLWLVFGDAQGLGAALCAHLRAQGREVIAVTPAAAFRHIAARCFALDPASEADYAALAAAVAAEGPRPLQVLHLGSLEPVTGDMPERFAQRQAQGLYSLLFLARQLAAVCAEVPIAIDLVTREAVSASGDEAVDAAAATSLGLAKVIPQELPQVRLRHIDAGARAADGERLAAQLLAEACSEARPLQLALRGARRWGLDYQPRRPQADAAALRIRPDGVYVITGGLGNIGLLLAGHLAGQGAAGLLLITRSAFLPPSQWDTADAAALDAGTFARVQRLRGIRDSGCKVLVCSADVADAAQMQAAFAQAESALGPIAGVIHAAGKVHDSLQPVDAIMPADGAAHFRAKVDGTRVLQQLLATRDYDFCLLMSSLSAVLGGLGFGAYAAANSYLDAVAQACHNAGEPRWLAVNWDGWLFGARSDATAERAGMSEAEGVEAFDLALRLGREAQLVNSTTALQARIAQWLHPAPQAPRTRSLHARPAVQSSFVAPRSATEQRLAAIWQDVLGIEQIGIRDNFFELGGDSVMLVQVHKAIRSSVNSGVAVASLFQYPAIEELARFLDKDDGAAVAAGIVSKRMERRRGRSRAAAEESA
ncbi:type I polyketide synthase [Tahibacter harae]|uniref:Condensation domain-containing protein n=1 Tax=Tahibacter harae TaxID=2963937 RepID=A0ABT1QP02_9GAMM|nr:type I polyketide synthase [Tahibacter harae]MCQ4163605.1 condensation domain-containing protein [Tahibacter harae]